MVPTTSFHITRYYLKMRIETASKSRAVSMLHERCAFLLLKAQLDASENVRCRIKAQNILSQLQRSLNITDPVSRGLYFLYDYCYTCLDRNTGVDIVNVQAIVSMLRDAFGILVRRP